MHLPSFPSSNKKATALIINTKHQYIETLIPHVTPLCPSRHKAPRNNVCRTLDDFFNNMSGSVSGQRLEADNEDISSNKAKLSPRPSSDLDITRETSFAKIASEDGGSAKKNADSETSTQNYEWYGRAPYDEFELQVKELCQQLWPASNEEPTKKPLVERMRKRLAGALRIKDSLSPLQFPTTPDRFIVERMRGGSYNRVAGITVMSQNKEAEARMVLRVPRGNLSEPEHGVAILQFVTKYGEGLIPVPEVVAHDFTSDNPLKMPYIVQKRIPGQDLETKSRPFPSLTQEQKITFVTEFVQNLVNMQGIKHEYAGRIDMSTDEKGSQSFTIGPFPVGPESDELIDIRSEHPFFKIRTYGRTYGIEPDSPDDAEPGAELGSLDDIEPGAKLESSGHTKPEDESEPGAETDSSDHTKREDESEYRTPLYFFLSQFGRWKCLQLEKEPAMIGSTTIFDRLAAAAKEMDEWGYLSTESYCLTHYDLDPRNIMCDIQYDGTLKMTGILDWDLAMFAPQWVSCKPPMWIWNWLDGGSEDESKANDTPPTPEQQELKELYESYIEPQAKIHMYNSQYRLARQLFRFAMFGLIGSKSWQDAEDFLEEWAAMYKMKEEEWASRPKQESDANEDPSEDADSDENVGCDDDNENAGSEEKANSARSSRSMERQSTWGSPLAA